MTVANAGGTIEVRINGSSVLSVTGDTQQSATAQWDTFRIGSYSNVGESSTLDFDDLYVADTSGAMTFLGPMRVVATRPDGDGTTTQFTPSAGSNWQNVDDSNQDGDSTYNSEATPGELDLYTFGALGVTGTVKAVQTNLCVRSAGGGAETIAPMFRIGGVNYTGTTVGLSTSYGYSLQVYETSPATGLAWTVSEIDGAEAGITLVS